MDEELETWRVVFEMHGLKISRTKTESLHSPTNETDNSIGLLALSRRLDRCDRVIQKESGDPNGGNMCSFSWVTGTSRVRHNADYVPCAQIRFDL